MKYDDLDNWSEREPHLVVIGFGNDMRHDDGAGVVAVQRLADVVDHPRLTLMTVDQLTPELADDLKDATHVIFVDAEAGISPGRVDIHPVHTVDAQSKALAHTLSPDDLMAVCRGMYANTPRAIAVGIGISDIQHGRALSPVVHFAVKRVTDLLFRAAIEFSCEGQFSEELMAEMSDA